MPDAAAWFETLDSRTAYEGFATVRVDTVRMPDGDVTDREVVEHTPAVAVVPLFDDGTVVLLRQYRHPVGRYLLEIPAGKLDVDGEDPADAARRELAEETGLQAAELVHLTTFENSAGWTTEWTAVHLGTGLSDAAPPDDFEAEHEEADMEIVRMALDDAVDGVARGEITDAKTIVGLLLAARR